MAKENVALLKGKVDVTAVIEELNAALSEEWLAYYQYWTAAQIVVGPQRCDIQKEFMKHAEEELKHADLLCKRIIELDGMPVTTPQQWYKLARCTYDATTSCDVIYFLKTIKIAEQCAMRRYQELADMTEGKDYITNDLAKLILGEEADHEQDMQDYLDDLNLLLKMACNCDNVDDCKCD